jgi:hypothetical protein
LQSILKYIKTTGEFKNKVDNYNIEFNKANNANNERNIIIKNINKIKGKMELINKNIENMTK